MQAETMSTKSRWRARKTGRNRKPGERETGTGDIRRAPKPEREADVLRVACAQPHRARLQPNAPIHVPKSLRDQARGLDDPREATDRCSGPRDIRAAYAFGRMRLAGLLTRVQHDALQHWLELCVRHSRALGLPQIHYGNCLAVSVGGGHESDEPDPSKAASRRERAEAAFSAMEQSMAEQLGPQKAAADAALVHVCLLDREPTGGMDGDLRVAANAIDRHMTGGGRRHGSA